MVIEVIVMKTENDSGIVKQVEIFSNRGYWLHELFRGGKYEILTFYKYGYIPLGEKVN